MHLLESYIFKDKDGHETALCVVVSTFLCQIWLNFLKIRIIKRTAALKVSCAATNN